MKEPTAEPARQNLIAVRFLPRIDLRRPRGGHGSPKNRTKRSPVRNYSGAGPSAAASRQGRFNFKFAVDPGGCVLPS